MPFKIEATGDPMIDRRTCQKCDKVYLSYTSSSTMTCDRCLADVAWRVVAENAVKERNEAVLQNEALRKDVERLEGYTGVSFMAGVIRERDEAKRLIERLQNVAAATRAYAEHFNMSACNAMETTDTMRGLTIKVAMVDALDALDNPSKPLKRKCLHGGVFRGEKCGVCGETAGACVEKFALRGCQKEAGHHGRHRSDDGFEWARP